MHISLYYAAILYLAYIAISQILFLYTSNGWVQIFEVFYLGWILLVMWLILLISALWNHERFIPRKSFLIVTALILLFQSVALLINCNDRGDGPGHYNFIQQLVSKKNLWEEGVESTFWIPGSIIFFNRMIYYFLNFCLIILLISAREIPR